MKHYNKSKESSYLKYWDANNLYGWTMSQKLPVNGFKWVEDISDFNENFIKSYNDESDEGYFLEADIQDPENLHMIHSDFLFLPKRTKIEKVEKLVANSHDKTEYFIHIRNLEQALKHGLMLNKVYRVIKFNQKVWLKSNIYMNIDLRKAAKTILKKAFSS